MTGYGILAGMFFMGGVVAFSFKGGFSWNSGTSFVGAGAIRVDPGQPCCTVTVNGSLSVPNLEVGSFGAVNVASGIGRASGRERGEISVAAVSLKKKKFKGGF